MKYEIVSSNFNIDETTGVKGDHMIRFTGLKTQKLYPKELRMIVFHDYETDEQLTFISNATDVLLFNGLEIATLVSVSALMKKDLQALVTDPHPELPTLFSDQDVN